MIPATLEVPYTKTLCLGLWAAHFLDQDTDTVSLCKLKSHHLQTSPQFFLLCHQMKTHEKILWSIFSVCLQCLEGYVSIKMYTSSVTEGPTYTSEILMPIPRFGQELSIYICFNRVKIDDLTHPK